MSHKIFKSTMVVAITVFLATVLLILGALYNYFGSIQRNQLQSALNLAVQGVEKSGIDYLENIQLNQERMTYIDTDGHVLFDSSVSAQKLENHADREEVKEAMEIGKGESSRFSKTLTSENLYYAKKLKDQKILRISTSRMTMISIVLSMLQPVLIVLLATLALAWVLAKRMVNRIVQPLNELDLSKPLENEAYDELAPLLTKIDSQEKKIKEQVDALGNQKNEFESVISHMKEGLALLDRNNKILSINKAALQFFSTNESIIGKDFLDMERNLEMNQWLEEAKKYGSKDEVIERFGKEYAIDITSIQEDGQKDGLVILVQDISDKLLAEKSRKEFTANVSHELKTPLHSIMGRAELMENKMVREEDVPNFARDIRQEATRLVGLIEDVLHLSKMDEKSTFKQETISLKEIVDQQVSNLQDLSNQHGIQLEVEGKDIQFQSVKSLVEEIVHNLIENGIKYNKEQGKVMIHYGLDQQTPFFEVQDTGIGIPKDQLERVFERFYRVDKSHSKEIGGTGLGLSIVKHAAEYLQAKISIQSEEEQGTTVRVNF